jgi:hypothetical protein
MTYQCRHTVVGTMYSSNPFAALAASCSGCPIPGKDLELIVLVLLGLGAGLDGHENSCSYDDLIPGLSSL